MNEEMRKMKVNYMLLCKEGGQAVTFHKELVAFNSEKL